MAKQIERPISEGNGVAIVSTALRRLTRQAGRRWPPAQMHAALRIESQVWLSRAVRGRAAGALHPVCVRAQPCTAYRC